MIEIRGNFWDYEADAYVLTTNGTIKSDGRVVMGRGVAKEALDRFQNISLVLGNFIKERGNHVIPFSLHDMEMREWNFYSFPVKHNWWEKADLELIERSCIELVYLVNELEDEKILIGRTGCGNGRRDWLSEVKPILTKHFDDRFYVITF